MTALRTSHKLLFKIYDRIRDAPAERAALGPCLPGATRPTWAQPVLGCLAGTSKMARRSGLSASRSSCVGARSGTFFACPPRYD
eukprot:3681784-Prymnesium_polylepis.1